MSTNQHSHGTHHPPKASHPLSQDEFASVLQPAAGSQPRPAPSANDQAVELIRQKVAALYANNEPEAKQEMREALLPGVQHSKHQQFMRNLHDSGRSRAQIQAEWHQYYLGLDDGEKRAVWQEFYSQSAQAKQPLSRIQPQYQYQPDPEPAATAAVAAPTEAAPTPQPPAAGHHKAEAIYPTPTVNPLYGSLAPPTPEATIAGAAQPQPGPAATAPNGSQPTAPASNPDNRQPNAIRQQLRQTIERRGKLGAKHHLQSLFFGLGFGCLTLLIVLFSFFNEVVIAPFIQPSRQVSATPIITSPDGMTTSDKDEVVIPKINVQIPLDFSAASTDEKQFEAALDKGVAHYPTTALPGQKGNASFFGHSSNNIFNPGKYKFAFVMLNELVPGDTFYINYKGVSYAYQVYDKKVVEATAVEILQSVDDRESTAMLVTCDPPGTSLRRLAVWGQQVSPNPASNLAAGAPATPGSSDATKEALPGNGPTLWGRITSWISGD